MRNLVESTPNVPVNAEGSPSMGRAVRAPALALPRRLRGATPSRLPRSRAHMTPSLANLPAFRTRRGPNEPRLDVSKAQGTSSIQAMLKRLMS
jgi:hypothetical protein